MLTSGKKYLASKACIKQASKTARKDLDNKDIWRYNEYHYTKQK